MATKNDVSAERVKALKQKRRAKKKARKHRKDSAVIATQGNEQPNQQDNDDSIDNEPLEIDTTILQHFSRVLDHFNLPAPNNTTTPAQGVNANYNLDDVEHTTHQNEEHNEEPRVSKKRIRKLTQLKVDELKQLSDTPDVVEPWDVTAMDPKLLVSLKAYRNTIPVPNHWWQRKPYLQRRKERKRWELPEFLKQTGIAEIRDSIKEKEAAARSGARRRARLNPKLGKMDLDYQKLHDAFYRFQTTPRLTRHGDLYYEGKENVNQFKPGKLSASLKEALDQTDPPPWLFGMQRYGPPPSYPHLVIPGVNSPIPIGGQWGYQKGQWGRPPVDSLNRPLYGDVFAVSSCSQEDQSEISRVDRTLWGELEPEEGDQITLASDEESDDEATGTQDNSMADEDEYLSEITVPDAIELRKVPSTITKKDSDGIDDSNGNLLYRLLPQIPSTSSSDFIPSQHTYQIPSQTPATETTVLPLSSSLKRSTIAGQDVDVSIEDPSQLEQKATLHMKYDQAQQERQTQYEDLSDMYLEHASKQAKRQEKRERDKVAKRKDI
ncbi:hypothetical protein BDB00DRAFT_118136 [Zychaea mexicana]|uniref:uncharacterized protein n=1 Tax=Zychaea mexicana TaxID=64656 RepID=UPI0022FE80C7|nr:uncharacterized protein BDB00DRAFT_118136 [Zychaea mexicana]KAI9496420.1 hypothetical protein BDB00DRAFT_118136 [Zychaea mexicana]